MNHMHRMISLAIAALALALSSASQAQVPTALDGAIALDSTGSGVVPLVVTAKPDYLAADEDGLRRARHRWLFRTSFFTAHFHPSPEHNNNQRLINFEYLRPDDWLFGAAEFRNSFRQSTQLVYVGKRWNPLSGFPAVHFKLIGGVVHGYKPPYEQKIPFNSLGFAPALLPVLGYSYGRLNTEIIVFGTAGMMWTIGYSFD